MKVCFGTIKLLFSVTVIIDTDTIYTATLAIVLALYWKRSSMRC